MAFSIARIVYQFTPMIGGSITHIIELSEQMNDVLSDQVIIAPNYPSGASSDKNFRFEVIRVPIKMLKFMLHFPSGALGQIIYSMNVTNEIEEMNRSGRNFDILHVHGPLLGSFIELFLKIKGLKMPVVAMCHGGYGDNGQRESLASGHFSKYLTRIMMRLFPADAYLALDDGTGVEIIQNSVLKMNKEYATVFHGLDTELYAPMKESIASRSDNCFRILFPHRIIPFKRPDIALDAIKILKERYNITKMVIIFLANDEESIQIQEKVRMNDLFDHVRIESPKMPMEMIKMYASCDVVIGTSMISNLNRAIQEAMSCEKAVVVFDSGNLNGLINQTNAVVVKNGDINDFADALWELYRKPDFKVNIGKEARKTIIHQRNWTKRIETEIAVYKSILSLK